MNPFLLAGLLYGGAALVLLPFMFQKREKRLFALLNKTNRLRITGAVIMGGIIGPVLLLFGLKTSQASSVSIWLNLELVATALIGYLFFKDSISKQTLIGIILTIGAGLILTAEKGTTNIVPALLVTGACFAWGFDNHFTALIDGITPVQSTFIKGLIAGTVNISIGLFESQTIPSYTIISLSLATGALSYGLSIVLYIKSAQFLGATRSQIIFSTAPFFGVILSIIFLDDKATWYLGAAGILLILSIYVLSRERHGHSHIHVEMDHIHQHSHDDEHHDHNHDDDASGAHSHPHKHQAVEHSHPHWPDLHHRHKH